MDETLTENYSFEKIRMIRKASNEPGSFFRQYEIELAEFSHRRFLFDRVLVILAVFMACKLLFQVKSSFLKLKKN